MYWEQKEPSRLSQLSQVATPPVQTGHLSKATHILQHLLLSCFGTSVAVLHQPFGSGQWSFLLCLPLLWFSHTMEQAQGSQMRLLLDELGPVFQQYIKGRHQL